MMTESDSCANGIWTDPSWPAKDFLGTTSNPKFLFPSLINVLFCYYTRILKKKSHQWVSYHNTLVRKRKRGDLMNKQVMKSAGRNLTRSPYWCHLPKSSFNAACVRNPIFLVNTIPTCMEILLHSSQRNSIVCETGTTLLGILASVIRRSWMRKGSRLLVVVKDSLAIFNKP